MIRNKEYFNESLPASFDGVFDWDFLKPAFYPTKIEPMDIDAIIERHGRFLIFETKTPGSKVPEGQKITLRALHELGCVTIFYLEGKKPENIEKFYVFYPADKKPQPIDLIGTIPSKTVVQLAEAWFKDADSYGKKTKL